MVENVRKLFSTLKFQYVKADTQSHSKEWIVVQFKMTCFDKWIETAEVV